MEKIEALKNNVDRSFDELRKTRNDLQYDYTIAPKLCGDKLITMKNPNEEDKKKNNILLL